MQPWIKCVQTAEQYSSRGRATLCMNQIRGSERDNKLSYHLEIGPQQCTSLLLSIAVMTYTYGYHLRNLRPMIPHYYVIFCLCV